MTKRNWSSVNSRDRMRRRGTEGAREDVPFMVPLLKTPGFRRRRVSKDELRSEAAGLVAAFTGSITAVPELALLRCTNCGHRGMVRMPAGASTRQDKAPQGATNHDKAVQGSRFKCSRCGSRNVERLTS